MERVPGNIRRGKENETREGKTCSEASYYSEHLKLNHTGSTGASVDPQLPHKRGEKAGVFVTQAPSVMGGRDSSKCNVVAPVPCPALGRTCTIAAIII